MKKNIHCFFLKDHSYCCSKSTGEDGNSFNYQKRKEMQSKLFSRATIFLHRSIFVIFHNIKIVSYSVKPGVRCKKNPRYLLFPIHSLIPIPKSENRICSHYSYLSFHPAFYFSYLMPTFNRGI